MKIRRIIRETGVEVREAHLVEYRQPVELVTFNPKIEGGMENRFNSVVDRVGGVK